MDYIWEPGDLVIVPLRYDTPLWPRVQRMKNKIHKWTQFLHKIV